MKQDKQPQNYQDDKLNQSVQTPKSVPNGAVMKYGCDVEEVLRRCPVPLLYSTEDFPKLSPNQLCVLNYLEQPNACALNKSDFARVMGWPPEQFSTTERSKGVVEARKALWTGAGNELTRHVPDVVKTRVAQAKTMMRGANQATRIVLETAGVLGQNAPRVTVNVTAEEMHVSFTESLTLIQQANQQRREETGAGQ